MKLLIIPLILLLGCGKPSKPSYVADWTSDQVVNAVPYIKTVCYEEGGIDIMDVGIRNGIKEFIGIRNETVEKHNSYVDSILKILPGAKSFVKYDLMLDTLDNGDIERSKGK